MINLITAFLYYSVLISVCYCAFSSVCNSARRYSGSANPMEILQNILPLCQQNAPTTCTSRTNRPSRGGRRRNRCGQRQVAQRSAVASLGGGVTDLCSMVQCILQNCMTHLRPNMQPTAGPSNCPSVRSRCGSLKCPKSSCLPSLRSRCKSCTDVNTTSCNRNVDNQTLCRQAQVAQQAYCEQVERYNQCALQRSCKTKTENVVTIKIQCEQPCPPPLPPPPPLPDIYSHVEEKQSSHSLPTCFQLIPICCPTNASIPCPPPKKATKPCPPLPCPPPPCPRPCPPPCPPVVYSTAGSCSGQSRASRCPGRNKRKSSSCCKKEPTYVNCQGQEIKPKRCADDCKGDRDSAPEPCYRQGSSGKKCCKKGCSESCTSRKKPEKTCSKDCSGSAVSVEKNKEKPKVCPPACKSVVPGSGKDEKRKGTCLNCSHDCTGTGSYKAKSDDSDGGKCNSDCQGHPLNQKRMEKRREMEKKRKEQQQKEKEQKEKEKEKKPEKKEEKKPEKKEEKKPEKKEEKKPEKK